MPFLSFLGGVVAFVAIIAFRSVWSGYVLSVLWGWFIAPMFHLPQLSVVAAIGLMVIVSYLTWHVDMDKPPTKDSWGDKFGKDICVAVMKPLFMLSFGWVVHFFM